MSGHRMKTHDTADDESQDQQAPAATIAHALDRWYARLGRQYGPLSRPQRRVMRLLASADNGELGGSEPPRVSDLADRLGMTAAGATRMVDTLEGLGYARRYRTAGTDQRQVYVALTDAGRHALREADAVFMQQIEVTLAPLSARERMTLAGLLRRLADEAEG